MIRSLAALAAMLLTTAVASAQGGPAATPGIERGVQEINNSGQVGIVTVLPRGASSSVVLAMKGVPGGRLESVRIYRGKSCETDIAEKPSYFLADLRGGASTSTVPMSSDRLLSGNYNVLVFSGTHAGARVTACGHLYLQ